MIPSLTSPSLSRNALALGLPVSRRRELDLRTIAGLSTWYDLSDRSSMIIDGSNRVSLIADKSGNSNVNCLCLNGTAGNAASVPNSAALQITGPLDIRAKLRKADWSTVATDQTIACKDDTVTRDWNFYFTATGRLRFFYSNDGSTLKVVTSSATTPFSNYGLGWVRVTFDTATGNTNFYTSTDGVTWTQLGTTQTTTAATIHSSTANLYVGGSTPATSNALMNVHRVQILDGIGGAVAFDCDFSTFSKLATSGTATTGQTVTINSSGDLGARISGERDLVQLTASKQPTYEGSTRTLLLDGVDDYMKSAPFSRSQPETVYAGLQQVSFTAFDRVYSGSDSAIALTLQQAASSPNIQITSGTAAASITNVLVGESFVSTAVFNSAASANRKNLETAVTGNANANNGNGFILGARGDSLGNYGNIRVFSVAVYSAAHSTAQQDTIISHLGRKHSINVAPFVVSITPSLASYAGANGLGTTNQLTATPSGGTGTYTAYLWEFVAGDAGLTIGTPNASSTNFSASGTNETKDGDFRVTVTDSSGATTTATAPATWTFGSPP